MKKLFFLLIGIVCAIITAKAGTVVKGLVISSEDGKGLPGVSVILEGTEKGTITGPDGSFILQDVPPTVKSLLISCLGYIPVTVPVTETVNVTLDPDAESLDEVVVTALGISRFKKAIGYAVQDVDGRELTKAAPANIANTLQGRIAGVQVSQAGGALGASQRINIRGNSSFNNNEPLIVVDGIPIDNSSGGAEGADGNGFLDTGSSLADINPEDIENISVLKGGSAAIYGMRAGNGVILITTKKGKSEDGKPKVTYDGSFAIDRVHSLPKYQNLYGQGYAGHEYAYKLYGEGYGSYQDYVINESFCYVDGFGSGINDGDDESWGPRLDSGLALPQYNSPIIDGQRVATPWVSSPDNIRNFFTTGFSNNHSISVSNSGKWGSYHTSVSYRGQKGVVPNTDINHIGAKLSADYNICKWVTADFSLNFVHSASSNLMVTGYSSDNPLQSIMQWFGRQVDMNDLKQHYNETMDNGMPYNWNSSFHVNPYFNLYNNTNSFKNNHLLGKASVFILPVEWLKIEGRFGCDMFGAETFRKHLYTTDTPNGWFGDTDEKCQEINADIIAYFDKKFGNFNLNAIVGANYRDYIYSSTYLGADPDKGLTIPGIYTAANISGTAVTAMHHSHIRSNSVYANISFGWNNQLYIEASARNDWSSTISQSFFYPSISASWIITESFPAIKGKALSFLKIRANYANIGNATEAYRTGLYAASAEKNIGGVSQFSKSSVLSNPNLKPENILTREIGINAAFLNNRLRFDIAGYFKTTSNQIMTVEVPASSGYSYEYINAGEVSNKGVEIQLEGDIFSSTKGFNWTSTVNFSLDRSKIISLAEGLDTYTLGSDWSCYNYAMVGKSWGTLVGTGLVYDGNGAIVVGEDGLPLCEDNKVIGNVTPDFLMGWENEFSYGPLSFGFLLDFKKGGDFFSVSQSFGAETGIYDYTASGGIRENGMVLGKDFMKGKNFVYEDGTPVTEAIDPYDFFYNSFYDIKELCVIDGTFLKLREMHLTYTFPKKMMEKTKVLKDARISLFGNNLGILYLAKNNYSHIDPESTLGSGNSSVGFESNACPPTRSFGIKLSLTF